MTDFRLKFQIKALNYPMLINFITIVSLNKEFLIDDNKFEKKFYVNNFVTPPTNPFLDKTGLINADIAISCLETKRVKGKVLISVFPEELFVLDFSADCVKNAYMVGRMNLISLQLLNPLPLHIDLDKHDPPMVDPKKKYFVRPGKSCIFKIFSPYVSNGVAFSYKKPQITYSTSVNPKLYKWNGFDPEGGIFLKDDLIELRLNCNDEVPNPYIGVQFESHMPGKTYEVWCSTSCEQINEINVEKDSLEVFLR